MMQEKRKVLIVDDDEGTRIFVEEIMRSEGWTTFTGVTGREALELASQEEPDLIILDVAMPEMDGFEAFQRLRTDPITKDIPIVMLTDINQLTPEARQDAESMEKRFGVSRPEAFVDKPVSMDFLLQTIMGVVG